MLAPGSKLGPYDIQSAIGAGGMGEVYRARDARLNRDVAIKILPASFSSDPDRLQRFAQEARAAAALSHPNILSIYDIGDDHGAPYVVSELLEGETLRDRLRNGPLNSRKAIEYARQLASGLAAAHEKGIVHRDLKPENIFITNDGRVKILDFGLAKLTRPEAADSGNEATQTQHIATDAGTVMGTVGYMAPEQVRGKPADPRSDIFAFGAILYEMLSGKRAFHGDSSADTMSAILKEDPPDLTETNRNVSPALERVVRHCLEKNPAERFQSARDITFNLDALSDISTTSRGGVRAIPEEPAKRRWLWPLLAALLVLASWAGIYALARRATLGHNPSFHEITFRNGTVWDARFAPDGQTVIYSAAWEGQPPEVFSTRFDSTDSRPVGLTPAHILGISSKGEMAVNLRPSPRAFTHSGTLARVPLAGGAPREAVENVTWADWAPDGQSFAVTREHPGEGFTALEYPPDHIIYRPKGWVSHVRFSPSGEYLAVADHVASGDDGRIVIVDKQGNRKASSSYYSSVEGLAWAPSGKEVWFSAVPAGSARSIYALDLSGKERLIYRAPGGLTIHDVSRSGLVLLTADKARITLTGLAPGESRERSLSWFDWSLVTDISDDGKTIIFSETGEAVGANYGIFIRNTDGSPAVRLGDGGFGRLSPDGKWVLASVGTPAKLVLYPTGVGETRQVTDDKLDHFNMAWLPDGQSVIFSLAEPGHRPRVYLQELNGGSPRPLTPEGVLGRMLTPDGKFLLAADSQHQIFLFPTAGGEPRKLSFSSIPNVRAIRVLGDGKGVLVATNTVPAQVFRVDLETGQRTPWKELAPADLAGVQNIVVALFSADGKSYAYSTGRVLSDLYVVDGLK
jgi:serine/threonine protein kinase/Tol biopolymer transport system component